LNVLLLCLFVQFRVYCEDVTEITAAGMLRLVCYAIPTFYGM